MDAEFPIKYIIPVVNIKWILKLTSKYLMFVN